MADRCLYISIGIYISIYMCNSPELKAVYTCHYLRYTYTELGICDLYMATEAIQNKPLL